MTLSSLRGGKMLRRMGPDDRLKPAIVECDIDQLDRRSQFDRDLVFARKEGLDRGGRVMDGEGGANGTHERSSEQVPCHRAASRGSAFLRDADSQRALG